MSFKHNPGSCECCAVEECTMTCSGLPCNACLGGGKPRYISVELKGLGSGSAVSAGCASTVCNEMNGTYITECVTCSNAFGICTRVWRWNGSVGSCSGMSVDVTVDWYAGSSDRNITVRIVKSVDGIRWDLLELAAADRFDCVNFAAQVVGTPATVGAGFCGPADRAGSTAELTTV